MLTLFGMLGMFCCSQSKLYVCLVQVAQHAQLKVAVHHGLNRTSDPEVLAQFDVVITSYETLRSDHRPSEADGLFG